MKKIILNKENRIKRNENYETLDKIRNEITKRINAEYKPEIKAIQDENEMLINEEKTFRANVQNLLKELYDDKKLYDTVFKVTTQTGKDNERIREYTGRIQNPQKYVYYPSEGCFNFICPEYNDEKPFTIGLSCLMGIEVISIPF